MPGIRDRRGVGKGTPKGGETVVGKGGEEHPVFCPCLADGLNSRFDRGLFFHINADRVIRKRVEKFQQRRYRLSTEVCGGELGSRELVDPLWLSGQAAQIGVVGQDGNAVFRHVHIGFEGVSPTLHG